MTGLAGKMQPETQILEINDCHVSCLQMVDRDLMISTEHIPVAGEETGGHGLNRVTPHSRSDGHRPLNECDGCLSTHQR